MSSNQPQQPAEPHLDALQQEALTALSAALPTTTPTQARPASALIKQAASRIKSLEAEQDELYDILAEALTTTSRTAHTLHDLVEEAAMQLRASRRRLCAMESEALCDVDHPVLRQAVLPRLFSGPSSHRLDQQGNDEGFRLMFKFSEISPLATLVALGALDPVELTNDGRDHVSGLVGVFRKLDWIVSGSSPYNARHADLASQIQVAVVAYRQLARNLHRLPSLRFVSSRCVFYGGGENDVLLPADLAHWRLHLTSMTSLKLESMKGWNQEYFDEIFQMTQLECLKLDYPRSPIPSLSPLTRLKRLVISFPDEFSLDTLAGVSTLTMLSLEYGIKNVDVLRQISSNTGLVELTLYQDNVFLTKEMMEAWHLPHLARLNLDLFKAKHFDSLRDVAQVLTTITHLHLQISNENYVIPPLGSLSRLQALHFAHENATYEDIDVDSDTLRGLDKLQRLSLEASIEHETILELPSLLPSLTRLLLYRSLVEPETEVFLQTTYGGRDDFELLIYGM